MFHYIYKVTFNDNYYYIGKHSTTNLDDGYKGSGKLLKEKYKDGIPFSFDIISWYDSLESVMKAERAIVGYKWKNDPLCLNMIGGGSKGHLGTKQSEEHITKRIVGKRVHPNQKEIAAKASKAAAKKRTGSKDSAETIEKRRQSLIEYNRNLEDKSRPYRYKAVVCDEVEYESVKKVMEVFGITRPTVINRIRSGDWDWRYK